MPSRFAFPRIRRFHPHDTTSEDEIPSHDTVNHTATTGSNSPEATDNTTSTSTTTGTHSGASRSRRTRGHGHRRHSRHSSSSSSKPPSMMIPTTNLAIQNFRLRWIDQEHEECPVCTKRFESNCVVTLLPCGHYFCQACMDQWFWKNHSSTCPLCRYDVLQDAANPCHEEEDCEDEDDEVCLDRDYQDWLHDHATEKCRNIHHLSAISTNSTDYLSLVTKVVLTEDMSNAKCEKLSDSLACGDGATSSFGNNFDLIMAKALHARRARMAYEMSSSMMDSFLLDNQD